MVTLLTPLKDFYKTKIVHNYVFSCFSRLYEGEGTSMMVESIMGTAAIVTRVWESEIGCHTALYYLRVEHSCTAKYTKETQ